MNDDIKKYQVVSSGEVLRGFSIIGVSESLAKLYKISAAQAIDTLICGKPRKVRSARSKAHAESICAKLQVMGLACGVSEVHPDTPDDLSMHSHLFDPTDYDDIEDDIEPMSESTDEAMASIDAIYKDATSKVAKSKFIKRVGSIVIFLSLSAFGSWFALNQWLQTESTSEIAQTELAMEALDSPAAIAFADLAKMRKLSSLSSAIGRRDSLQMADLAGISNLLVPLSVLNSQLLFTKSRFLSAGLYTKSSIASPPANDWLMVLNGEFARQKVINELKSMFVLSSQNEDLFKLALREPATLDEGMSTQCSVNSATQNDGYEWFFAFTETAIIFSSSAELNYRFQSKLTSLKLKSPEPSSNLQLWQAYRQDSLLSVKSFDQNLLSKNPSTDKFVRSIFGESSFTSASLKLVPELLKQGINASLEFASDDLASLDAAKQALLSSIATTQSELSSDFPVINKFLSSLVVSQAGSLVLSAKVGGELIADINGVGADLNNIVNDGVLSKPIKTDILEFKQATKIWNFNDNATVLDSKQKRYIHSYEPVYERQGLEIYVDSIGAKNRTNSSRNTLKLTAVKSLSNMSSADEWAQSGIQQKFSISDVTSQKGKSLLTQSQCQLANQLNSGLNSKTILSKDGFLKTSLSVPLISSVSPSDIHRLKGQYELNVPTDVQRVGASMQANRKVIWADGYFRLSRIQGSTVQYRVLGNTQNLLAVRALNAQGEVLNQHDIRQDGDITTAEFSGGVASLDVFIAKKWQSDNFEFAINSVQAKPTNKHNTKRLVKRIEPLQRADRNKFRKRLSSERTLALFPASSTELGRSKTKTSQVIFNLVSSNRKPYKLTGYIIIPFNELLLADQDSLNVYLEINKKYKIEFKPNFNKANSVITDSGRRYFKGEFSIRIDKLVDQVSHLRGNLKFALPRKFSRRVATVGNRRKDDLRLLSYIYGDNPASYYRSKEDYDIGFLTSKSGDTYLADITSSRAFKFTGFAGEPKKIELLNVSRRSRFSEKFRIKIDR